MQEVEAVSTILSFKIWISFLVSLIAVTDPIGFIPIYLGLTKDFSQKKKNRTIITALFVICLSLSLGIWFGEGILHFFGITIGDFQISGGLILLTLGMAMMKRSGLAILEDSEEYHSNVGVVPLAIPLVAGPGTFTMILVETHNHDTLINKFIITTDVFAMGIVIAIILFSASKIRNVIGVTGIEIATKIMGMIVLAEAIERITEGLYNNFPILHI